MAATMLHKFNIVRFQRPELIPEYKILMISDNVEFLPPFFYAMFWQPF
jgi:hypothetical protein